MIIKNTVFAITGAGSGIGRALAIEMAKKEVKVALTDINEANLQETKLLVEQYGGEAIIHPIDAANKDQMIQWAADVVDHYGQVDGIINNAGVALGKVSIRDVSYEDFEWIVGINMWGMIYGTKAFLPHIEQRPQGCIVNISSVFGLMGVAYQAPYCTTKFAIRGFTESLRMELMNTTPHVNAISVHPGGIKTNIARDSRFPQNVPQYDTSKELAQFEKTFRTTAARAALIIINGIERNKKRVLVGNDAHVIDRIIRWMPVRYTNIVSRALKRFDNKGN